MQSRCHIKYNLLPFPPRLRLRPRCRLSLSLSLPFYGTPLDFHGNRGTLTLGLAVARRLCENYRPFPFFPIAPSFQENAANLSLSPLIVPLSSSLEVHQAVSAFSIAVRTVPYPAISLSATPVPRSFILEEGRSWKNGGGEGKEIYHECSFDVYTQILNPPHPRYEVIIRVG